MGAPPIGPADEGLDLLIRRIVERHHSYVRDVSPVVAGQLDELVADEGDRHPELFRVRELFRRLRDELLTHMVKEEHILFPFISDLAVAARSGARPPAGPFGTLLNPIRVMESDHHLATELVEQIRGVTKDYAVPPEASDAYRRCYEELSRFEADLIQHVQVENDVLFPGALALERRVG